MLTLSSIKFSRIIKYIKLVVKHPRPIRLMIGYILIFTKISQLIKIRQDGYKIFFTPSSLALSMFINPNERYMDNIYLNKILSPGDNFIDIGANIGTLTIKAAQIVSQDGKVFSFEAHPKISEYLRKNVKLNELDNVEIFNYAAGESSGKIVFSDIGADDQNSVVTSGTGIEVGCIRLDDLLPDVKRYKLLKIDTEGFELFVLRGTVKLYLNIDYIYFESDEEHFKKYGYSLKDISKFLSSFGFEIFRIDENRIKKLGSDYVSHKRENLFAGKDLKSFSELTGYTLN